MTALWIVLSVVALIYVLGTVAWRWVDEDCGGTSGWLLAMLWPVMVALTMLEPRSAASKKVLPCEQKSA